MHAVGGGGGYAVAHFISIYASLLVAEELPLFKSFL
jgi:hypothetical protein